MTKIHTSVELSIDSTTLNISTSDKLKSHKGNLKNFGYIQVTTGTVDEKPVFWDGIDFFLECGKKQFKKECEEDLDKAGFDCDTTYKSIKKLLKRAVKLKLLCIDKETSTIESARKKAKLEYVGLINSGMFFEFYGKLTGDWERDKEEWFEIHSKLEDLRASFLRDK